MDSPSSWHPAVRHASIFGITLTAIALSVICAVFVEPSYFLPLTAAVVVCSWLFGREGGLHATVVGAVLSDFFLIRPLYSFNHARRADIAGLCTFAVVGFVLTWLTSSLRRSQELQTSILEGMSDALIVTDRRGSIIYLNPAALALSGFNSDAACDEPFEKIFPLTDEETGATRAGIISQILASASPAQTGAHTLLKANDGAEYSVEENAAPIRGRDGKINGAIIVLRNTTRRRQMQDQLTQSQKMDAIARLAGGVAGDFNNLLTVITGFGELLTSEMDAGNPLRRFAEEILRAAERAAALTRQLMAFGKKQSAPAKPYDLNVLVTNMETMMSRVLGPNVELILLARAKAPRINTDPGQIEQVVVNLAMNARDAMPEGGKFVVETSDVEVRPDSAGKPPDLESGQYVMLVVTDTGAGMDAETRKRLFEPFFTTKMQGRGSGLGLAIVYGIVRQHGGYISVYSQPGSGTIFEIYFPRMKEVPEPVAIKGGPRGSETILIADDEESVRKLVHHVLVAKGYRVIEARDGKEALDLFEKNREFLDLVLTDIVMPQMSGYDLGKQIEKMDPAKKIIYMSGYRDASAGMDGENSRPFLNKPFTPELLLKQVRETLDAHGAE